MIKHNWKQREAALKGPPAKLANGSAAQPHQPKYVLPQPKTSEGSQYYVPLPAQVFQIAPPPFVPGRKALRL